MAATTSPPPTLNLCAVLSESKRILNAHSRHFLALSVLFLLPLSFSFIVFPTLQNLLASPIPDNSQIFLSLDLYLRHHHRDQSLYSTKTLFLTLAFSVFVFVFSLCAVGSITYSVFHGFYGRPVKLLSAVKSVFSSFFRLMGTALFVQIIVSVIVFIFGLSLFLVVTSARVLGFQVEISSPYFLGLIGFVGVALMVVLVYLQVNWILVCVVVVVESTWGFEALRRSAGLIKGMRGIGLSLSLFFGFFSGLLAWCSSFSAMGFDNDGADGWKSWQFVVQIVVTSTFLMLVLLYDVAANTVLYMYCKALHGELATEIAEEFAWEYVCLPFDDGKVPHLVSVAYN
ncbi:Transmembrane protein [Parasponia andersonii]|uniref:Transmembrane protein n=1 Tax=Parasponia andersonii TaxID=3476 RepID=A0A2P5BZD9_PARAD|nr:Transmembrane protein [Parasponia andersonii]